MIPRRLTSHLNELLRHSPAVVLLGPRQAGKTTLALEIGAQTASIYLDLEDENDRARLSNPGKYLACLLYTSPFWINKPNSWPQTWRLTRSKSS